MSECTSGISTSRDLAVRPPHHKACRTACILLILCWRAPVHAAFVLFCLLWRLLIHSHSCCAVQQTINQKWAAAKGKARSHAEPQRNV